jgi:hypothetical protein
MTTFKTLAVTAALSLFAGSAALAADSMGAGHHGMMKSDAAMMKKCEAMGDKAKTNAKCMAMTKKMDAMKGDPMKADPMKGDAMKGDSMASEHH